MGREFMRIDQNVTIDNHTLRMDREAGVETQTTATQSESVSATKSQGVFSLQIDKGNFLSCSSWEEVMTKAETMNSDTIRNEMGYLSNTMSADDYNELAENGFSLDDANVDTIVTVMDKIKMTLLEAGVDISCFGEMPTRDQLEKMGDSKAQTVRLQSALKEQNLPTTQENVSEGIQAENLAATLEPLDDSSKKYMLSNQLDSTIENIYKAEHSKMSSQPISQQMQWDTMEPQMQQVVEQADLKETSDGMAMSKWLVSNDIPLTVENLEALDTLSQLQLPQNQEQVQQAVVEAIAEGNRPMQANLSGKPSLTERAVSAKEIVDSVDDEDLEQLVLSGRELTIANLAQQMEDGSANQQTPEQKQDQNSEGKLLTARRQLEEIRLQMSVQANYSLLKQGVQIETEPLVKLVDELKTAEDAYYSSLLAGAQIEPTDENIATLRDTTNTVEELKQMPAMLLSAPAIPELTLSGMHEAGKAIDITEQYETLMTQPRADLGDNIQKAFQNVDDILTDLGMETTSANERAVRILGYNNQEITKESIETIKMADAKVQKLFGELKPAVTMELIRQGVSPLDTEIGALTEQITQMKESDSSEDADQYAKYLWKLDQSGEITDDQRESYIGIYRLVKQVEQTDGAVVGALVAQEAPLTLKNLLMGVKTGQNRGIDVSIEDGFGVTEEITYKESTIAQQLNKSFHKENTNQGENVENIAEYEKDCAKTALSSLTPDILSQLSTQNGVDPAQMQQLIENMTPEQLKEQIEMLKNTQQERTQQIAYAQEQLEQFGGAVQTEEDVLNLLQNNGLNVSLSNIQAATEYFQNRNKLYEQLFSNDSPVTSDSVDFTAIKEDILTHLADSLESPVEMAEAQETLAEVAENVMKGMLPPDKDVTSVDVRNLKLMYKQLQLNTNLAKNEQYAIPVLVEDEMATVHLKIVRTGDEKGKVNMVFEADSLGKVAAQLSYVGNRIEGLIAGSKSETVDLLSLGAEELAQSLKQSDEEVSLNYVKEEELDLCRFEMESENTPAQRNQDTAEQDSSVQTIRLYQMSKSLFANLIKVGKSLKN